MKLKDWLDIQGVSATELAQRIAVAPSTITRIVNGESEPTYKVMRAIFLETRGKVKMEDLTA